MSKVFKRLMYKQRAIFMDNFSKNVKYGFRKGYSYVDIAMGPSSIPKETFKLSLKCYIKLID